MGNCGSYPQKFVLTDLQDLTVGETKQSSSGCCPSIPGVGGGSGYEQCVAKGFDFPQNGEFQFALGGSCGLCSNIGSYGCGCTGSGSIGGSLPAVQRINFNADPIACCLDNTGSPLQGNNTCDPQYRGPYATGCASVIQKYCDNSQNFFTDTCKQWLKNQARTSNGAVVDTLANKYCPASTDPLCACFNSKLPAAWANDVTKTALFRCLDPTCQGGSNPLALKPFNLVCPNSYVDCQQDNIRLQLQQSGIDKVTVANNCGNISLGTPPPTASPTASPTPTPSAPSAPSAAVIGGLSKTMIATIVGSALLFLIFIIILIAVIAKKKKA